MGVFFHDEESHEITHSKENFVLVNVKEWDT